MPWGRLKFCWEHRGGGSGDVVRVGEARWLPVRGHLVGGEMRELEGSPRIYFIYLAENKMPWGQLKFRWRSTGVVGVVMRVGEARWLPLRGHLFGGRWGNWKRAPGSIWLRRECPAVSWSSAEGAQGWLEWWFGWERTTGCPLGAV